MKALKNRASYFIYGVLITVVILITTLGAIEGEIISNTINSIPIQEVLTIIFSLEVLTIIFSFIVTLFTVINVVYTKKQLRQMEIDRKLQCQPLIQIVNEKTENKSSSKENIRFKISSLSYVYVGGGKS